jgi:hypothetical protein
MGQGKTFNSNPVVSFNAGDDLTNESGGANDFLQIGCTPSSVLLPV